ncbi:MAG: tetratricopeptide repeat protein, partial [Chloroflexota bacterium]
PITDITGLPLMHPGRPVGRDDMLKTIFAQLQSQEAVLLHGDSGNGKTALAAALATVFIQQGRSVMWLNGRTHPLPALLVQLGRALGVDDVTTTEQPASRVGALSTALTDKRPIVVLDNVEDAYAVQQFIDKAADNIPVMILSDDGLDGSWNKVAVTPLQDTDAVVLFKQKSGIKSNDFDIDIYGITKLVDYQPLSIALAARGMVAAKQTPGDYFKNLKTVTQNSGDSAMAAIALNYRALSNVLQGVLLMLGATFRGYASVDLIAKVSGVPEDGIKQAVTILSQLYMVQKYTVYGKDYYSLHPLVYDFTQAALQGQNQLANLQAKIHTATVEYALDNIDQPENLAKEMTNFLATAQWATDNGNRDTANDLVSILTDADDFVQDGGYVYELLTLRNLGSGSTTAFPAYEPEPTLASANDDETLYEYEDDIYEEIDSDAYGYDDDFLDDDDESIHDLPAPEDTILGAVDDDDFDTPDLGDLNIHEGMDSQALRTDALQGIDLDQLRLALTQAKQQDDTARIIQIYKAIGKVQVGQDKETEAIATYNELLDIYENDGDEEGILDTLNMLGALLTKTGNSQAAVMHATRGIQMAKSQEDSITELQMYIIMGDARQDLGETQAAVESFQDGLEVARKTDDRQHEAILLYKLGNAHLDNGDVDDAVHSLEQARALFKEQVRRGYEGQVLGALGSAYSERAQWSEAIGYHTSALYIAREVEDRDEERLQLSSLAQAQEQANKVGEALQSYRQALHLAFETDNRNEIVSAVVDLVRLLLISPVHLDIAMMLLNEALEHDPDDRDVLALRDEVTELRADATAKGKEQRPVTGTAQAYAANAYQLLEQ